MATYAGLGFCENSEYQQAYEARLQYDELTRGGLYVARFELPFSDRGYRILGRVGLLLVSADHNPILKFQMLDDDMNPVDAPNAGYMNDGCYTPNRPAYVHIPGTTHWPTLRNGCLNEYEEGEGWNLHEQYELLLGREFSYPTAEQ